MYFTRCIENDMTEDKKWHHSRQRVVSYHPGLCERPSNVTCFPDRPHIPSRLYQHWAYRILDIEAPLIEEYDPGEAAEKLVSDILNQLLRLGQYLARQPKVRGRLEQRLAKCFEQQLGALFIMMPDGSLVLRRCVFTLFSLLFVWQDI